MIRPRRVLALLVPAIAVIALAAPARAEEQIDTMQVSAVVNADATVSVTEKIVYQFPQGMERHGIERRLVIADDAQGGGTWHYGIDITSVTVDGQPAEYQESDDGSYLDVRIGNADVLVTGTKTYEISYDITGALRTYTAGELDGSEPYAAGDVEFYWDLIGSEWQVPIAAASATVTGPQPALAYGCYAGPAGSEDQCTVTEAGSTLAYGPVRIDPGSALTAVVAYPGSAFTTVPTPDISQPGLLDSPLAGLLIGLPLGILGLVIPIVVVLTQRRRLRGAELDGAPVQFAPPGDLRPAQLQASAEGVVDERGALATLLDLVARGHIALTANDGGLLGKDSITVTWKSTNPDDLAPWEQQILAPILNGADEGTIRGYNPAFAAAVKQVSASLVAEATKAGRWSADPNPKWKGAFRLVMAAGILIGVGGFFVGIFTGHVGALVLCLTWGILMFIGGVVAVRLVPIHQTQESAQFLAEFRGFRKLLDTDAAEARRELAQRMGLPDYAVFAAMIPYAVIYDLAESWTGAFPDLEPEDLRRAGYNLTSTSMLYGMLATSRSSLQQATAPPQNTRSGGSGFSGGSAGGGGGGGGGGSW